MRSGGQGMIQLFILPLQNGDMAENNTNRYRILWFDIRAVVVSSVLILVWYFSPWWEGGGALIRLEVYTLLGILIILSALGTMILHPGRY